MAFKPPTLEELSRSLRVPFGLTDRELAVLSNTVTNERKLPPAQLWKHVQAVMGWPGLVSFQVRLNIGSLMTWTYLKPPHPEFKTLIWFMGRIYLGYPEQLTHPEILLWLERIN